jgi:hypothetical protein
MAKEPEQRPTASEFAVTLRGLMENERVLASRA